MKFYTMWRKLSKLNTPKRTLIKLIHRKGYDASNRQNVTRRVADFDIYEQNWKQTKRGFRYHRFTASGKKVKTKYLTIGLWNQWGKDDLPF